MRSVSDPPSSIDLARGEIPFEAVREELRGLDLGALLATGFNYSDAGGLPALREIFVDRFATWATRPDDTLVTAGALSALDLAFRSLGPQRAPARLIVQEPTYREAISIARARGMQVVDWETAVAGGGLGPADLVYVVPSLNNPDGRTLTVSDRATLVLAVCTGDAALVEDAAYELLDPAATTMTSITAEVLRQRPDARAVRLLSFSKVAVPGARVCVVEGSAPALIALRREKADFGTSPLSSALIACLIGHPTTFESHLARISERLERGHQSAREALGQWDRPPTFVAGGYFVWLETGPVTGAEIVSRAARAGLDVADGAPFFVAGQPSCHVRLSVAWEPPARIAVGLSVLEMIIDMATG